MVLPILIIVLLLRKPGRVCPCLFSGVDLSCIWVGYHGLFAPEKGLLHCVVQDKDVGIDRRFEGMASSCVVSRGGFVCSIGAADVGGSLAGCH